MYFWNLIHRYEIGEKIIYLSPSWLASEGSIVGAGGENRSFSYFYKLVFEAYK